MKKDRFLEKARNTHGYRYQYPNLPDTIMQKDIIDVLFEGVIYKQRVLKHFMGNRPENKTINKTTDQFISESKNVWGDKYDYSLTEYINSRTKVKIIYDDIIYEQLPNGHLQKYPVEGYLDQHIFIQKAKKKHGDKYDYSLVEFKDAKIKVKIKLGDKIYEQSPHNHLSYCPEKVLKRKTTEQFTEESKIIHDGKYSYDKTIYLTDREKLTITCPIHGDFTQVANAHLRGSGCPHCNESQGEKEISRFLNKYEIGYYKQHRFEECRGSKYSLPFDFYIPSIRTCIEFDGQQHHSPLKFFGGIPAYESLRINDKIKSDYCEEHYIDLIRIKYDQFNDIYHILWENLGGHIKRMKTT